MPETAVIAGAPFSDTVDQALQDQAQLWESMNYIRLAVYYLIRVSLLFAVNRNISATTRS